MKKMTTEGQFLAQDDVDSILAQAGLEGGYEPEDPDAGTGDRKRVATFKRRTEEELKAITTTLFNRAFLERDEGIAVIWNAVGVMPLETGLGIKVKGTDCITLGVLHQRHLLIRNADRGGFKPLLAIGLHG